MEDVLVLTRLLKDEQHKVKVLEQKLAVYEDEDLDKEGYFSLKLFVRQQIDIVKDFKLKEEIIKNPKDDKYYDRVNSLGEGLKKMITDLNALRQELKITPEEEKSRGSRIRMGTSPESVASSLNNIAGQNN